MFGFDGPASHDCWAMRLGNVAACVCPSSVGDKEFMGARAQTHHDMIANR